MWAQRDGGRWTGAPLAATDSSIGLTHVGREGRRKPSGTTGESIRAREPQDRCRRTLVTRRNREALPVDDLRARIARTSSKLTNNMQDGRCSRRNPPASGAHILRGVRFTDAPANIGFRFRPCVHARRAAARAGDYGARSFVG